VTLFLNGCSYALYWNTFPGVNLGVAGGSNIRTIRTTMEWIVHYNTKPDWVFMPITYLQRFEKSFIKQQNVPIEGTYIPSRKKEYRDLVKGFISKFTDTDIMYYDYLFMNIIMFSAWLSNQGIKHLIWDQCNNFNREELQEFEGIDKLKLIEENPNVIPLFEFCGNLHMYNNGGTWDELNERFDPQHKHYSVDSYSHLKDYLTVYAKEKLNEQIDW